MRLTKGLYKLKKTLVIDLKNVKDVYKDDEGLLGTKKLIIIETKDGEEHKFVMWGRDTFIEEVKDVQSNRLKKEK